MSLSRLRTRIEPLRQSLLQHPIYRDMREVDALRIFMEHHIFAVWDFMSLLKALQQHLCCVTVPWFPETNAKGTRLINEIVLGEESDENGHGGFGSHFTLYYNSMTEFQADTKPMDDFLRTLQIDRDVPRALVAAKIKKPIQHFVHQTFAIINTGDPCQICSAFTYGREDLLPDVFQRIVDEQSEKVGRGLDTFKYYLHRHIQLDKDEHGPMASRLMTDLCGEDDVKWQAAERAAVDSLTARLEFWNGIHAAILRNN